MPLNAVRARAGLSPVTAADQAALRNTILHERRVELAFEDKRFDDLVRVGSAVNVLNAYGTALKTRLGYLSPSSHIVTPDKLLLPIPAAEIGLNTELTQNPGY